MRFSFYDLPVFRRVDPTVVSDVDAGGKWPTPFPEWPVGASALMNVVWAIKHHERLGYSTRNVFTVLDRLGAGGDTDELLLAKTSEAVPA